MGPRRHAAGRDPGWKEEEGEGRGEGGVGVEEAGGSVSDRIAPKGEGRGPAGGGSDDRVPWRIRVLPPSRLVDRPRDRMDRMDRRSLLPRWGEEGGRKVHLPDLRVCPGTEPGSTLPFKGRGWGSDGDENQDQSGQERGT